MQTERYVFFVAVAFTLKITLIDRAYKRSFAFYVIWQFARHFFNSQTFISSRELDLSSWKIFRKAGNSNPLGNVVEILSSIVRRFAWMHSCTSCFSTSPSNLALPGESQIPHSHLLVDMSFSDSIPKIVSIGSPVIGGSVILTSFRQGPGVFNSLRYRDNNVSVCLKRKCVKEIEQELHVKISFGIKILILRKFYNFSLRSLAFTHSEYTLSKSSEPPPRCDSWRELHGKFVKTLVKSMGLKDRCLKVIVSKRNINSY